MQGDSHYDYDAYGNLTRERRGAAQRLVTKYRYDNQHRLIATTLPDGRVAEYRYDAFGRRIAKTIDGQTTEFLWQGERLIAESGQNHYRSYVYEPGTFRPLAMLHGEGKAAEPYYYQLDHLGTPQELTSAAGSIVWSAKYRAYGNVAKLEVAELENPLRFQGQYFDQETGLHYNRHRYYNPNTGRFLTPDPIKLAGGLNNYQYVPNPTGWVDPLGLNNCPGIASCSTGTAETPTANINSGEPNAPSPERSREERQSKIERLSEANAKRRVKEYEERYDMHTITKHGPEIPRDKLKQRAIDGTDPSNGELPKKAKGNPSSQFKNWKLQLHAINAALTREARGLPLHTGVDHKGNNIVRVDLPGAGRGYKPNKKDPQNPKFNENMNGAEVKFDKDNTRRPFTAFPVDNL
nr:RHS repeat-associated core domain-containing protein [Pseudomonas luteola]